MTERTYSAAANWPAPLARGPLHATVKLPGSKSLTNRELVLAALAEGPSTLLEPLFSRDSHLMIDALSALGASFALEPTSAQVIPLDSSKAGATVEIDCGLAGTVMRFVPPLAALHRGRVRFDGDAAARRRPMSTTISSLRALGVEVIEEGEPGQLPFTVVGTGQIAGGELTIDASESSQFVSGLLLSAARFTNGLTLKHEGEHLPSLPHIEMTLHCLRQHGVDAKQISQTQWRVEPGAISGGQVQIEPDLSNAGPFLAAAMVAGGSVTIPHWPASTTQVGDEFDGILQQMGATITRTADALTITGDTKIRGIDIDLSIGGELAPVIAALAAIAESPSRITGIAHLRGHETDRLAALSNEINKLGAKAVELEDGLEITPIENPHGCLWLSYEDHRMATAGAIVGLRVPNIEVDDIDCTSKTMPNFTELWSKMIDAQ